MSGLVGAFLDVSNLDVTLKMAKTIVYTSEAQIDWLSEGDLAVARVHHGIVNPEKQPIFNEDGSLCIMMDGEVFDWEGEKQYLINKGHQFRYSHNDAEYCLHLWEEKGEKGLAELNGSFLLVFFDRNNQELILVNDRFSSHPLFYYCDERGLVFGTQLRPLLLYEKLPRKINLSSIFDFLNFGSIQGDKTYYENVRILPPATILRFKHGTMFQRKYWEMRYHEENYPEEYYVEALKAKLMLSVERRTRDNKRFGLLLSGGIDSRAVLTCFNKKAVGITLGDFENREVYIAKRVCEVKGFKHIFLRRGLDYYPQILDLSVDISDGMFSFVHAHNLGFTKQIKDKCEVLFSGFGFDTLFKGLHIPLKKFAFCGLHFETLVPKLKENTSLQAVADLILEESLYKDVKRLFRSPYREMLKDYLLETIWTLLDEALACGAQNAYRLMDYFVFHGAHHVPEYLHVLHNRAFIDERTVSFDNDLFDLYLSMPYSMRKGGRVFRKVLRKLDPKLASLPNANTGFRGDISPALERSLLLGKSMLKGIGFIPREGQLVPDPTFTMGSWPEYSELIRRNEKLKCIMHSLIKDEKALNPRIFDTNYIQKIFQDHLSKRKDYTEILLLLITFGRWQQKYGPH